MSDVSPSFDWRTLYPDIEARGNVPSASATTIDAAHAVFRAMYLDLGEVHAALTDSCFDPPLVTLLADVLYVPAGLTWLLQDAVLLVHARRLQSDGTLQVSLDYRAGSTAQLVLFCDELVGTVQAVVAPGFGPPVVFGITEPPPDGGVRIHLQNGSPVQSAIDRSRGVSLAPTEAFEQAMCTEFIFGSLLYDLHPELVVKQLAWLKSWTGYQAELQGTFLRSSSLLALLSAEVHAEEDGTTFVPYLTRQIYTDLAGAFVNEARQYEADYRALSTEKVVTDNFLRLARNMLANKTHESDYTARLLLQAKSNFDNAAAAVAAAEQRLGVAQLKAQQVAADFENIGVPEWEREAIAKAVISLGTAIITFGVGIGAMFVGDPAGGAAAAGGAIEGAKAAAAAAEAGSEAARQAKQVGDAMKQLKKIVEVLKKLYELSKAIVMVVGDLRHAGDYAAKMRGLDVDAGGADLTATYEWQIYQQVSDASLAGPLSKGIRFAGDLKLAVDAVAVYGQALAAAQVAAIAAGQRYAEVSLRQQLAEREQEELARYVDALVSGEQPLTALMQRFYQRYLDAKSSLFAALQAYRASYFYWALVPSAIRPSIIEGVDRLDAGLKDLTGISLDSKSALERFSPPPQVLSDKRLVVTDPTVLADLVQNGTAHWVVPLAAEEFEGFDRTRLTRVRVWLENVKPRSGSSINVVISTQGNYLDRFHGKNYQFTSKPLTRDFEYRISGRNTGSPDWSFENGTYGYVEVDGAVDSEVSYAYFQPTPFAEWTIRVSNPTTVDLSGVSAVVMQFAGSVIRTELSRSLSGARGGS